VANLRSICLLLLFLFCVLEISAQEESGNPENWCRNGHFPLESDFKLATVAGIQKTRVYFLNDFDDCPQSDNPKCVEKSYVIPGDKLIVTRKYGKWICGWYQPRKGRETVGWIPAANLVISPPETNPIMEKWFGEWKSYENSLEIKKDARAGFIKVTGNAFWQGFGDNIHIGEVNASAKPNGSELVLEDDICRIRLILIDNFLIAGDNLKCGGANVTFNGVFQKTIK
jgi:hypothetical protein